MDLFNKKLGKIDILKTFLDNELYGETLIHLFEFCIDLIQNFK